ncbi:hypothetical protein VOLCADRAFT_92941 [Volvox carteri f. nagariensis]|uniref:Uncharacterized protein n=1 Tax=Volvox carteri f. nagariensis TaxID=3068 RepID=D8U0V3_VOLCA|nr:uncharacterized protein VOLCADRAFT_92941 [Volvox carteri f. nagariensis]EFJ46781.1 hypothetical protein VOLCADRAFT_92941 [Volvox carteri f. nagariensis]|eukprot:XP_002952310.1 hypothetical protein VOLCADRAFT_92941 [Volvox carteri f. nagariensis]
MAVNTKDLMYHRHVATSRYRCSSNEELRVQPKSRAAGGACTTRVHGQPTGRQHRDTVIGAGAKRPSATCLASQMSEGWRLSHNAQPATHEHLMKTLGHCCFSVLQPIETRTPRRGRFHPVHIAISLGSGDPYGENAGVTQGIRTLPPCIKPLGKYFKNALNWQNKGGVMRYEIIIARISGGFRSQASKKGQYLACPAPSKCQFQERVLALERRIREQSETIQALQNRLRELQEEEAAASAIKMPPSPLLQSPLPLPSPSPTTAQQHR